MVIDSDYNGDVVNAMAMAMPMEVTVCGPAAADETTLSSYSASPNLKTWLNLGFIQAQHYHIIRHPMYMHIYGEPNGGLASLTSRPPWGLIIIGISM